MVSTKSVKFTGMFALFCALLMVVGCSKKKDETVAVKPQTISKEAPKAKFHSGSPAYTNWWLEWSGEIYLGGYKKAGKRDPKWDETAESALENFSYQRVFGQPPSGIKPEALYEQLKKATDAGCTDPLIGYLYIKLDKPAQYANAQTAAEYTKLAKSMEASGYSPLIKFFLCLRTAQACLAATTNHHNTPEVDGYRHKAMQYLMTSLRQEELPAYAAYDVCHEAYVVLQVNSTLRSTLSEQIQPVLMSRWSDEGFPYLLKGIFYIDYAWQARGSDWAPKVTDKGWEQFADRLKTAEAALSKAWELDLSLPETPVQFMKLELGQGRGRERMEQWFERAIVFPRERYDAVDMKLWYLQPRWYGSEEACLAAAREVLKSDQFDGNVPLHLYHLHESLARYFGDSRPNYWTEPQVWPDIKASFERYFQLNGDDNSWRHNYVMCAWRCEQWKVLDDQIAKLTSVDYDYFGGKKAFEDMKQKAHDLALKGH